MKEYFDTEIKPYNDRLKKQLGRKIDVEYFPREREIDVMLWVKNSPTTKIMISPGNKKFYDALGLVFHG